MRRNLFTLVTAFAFAMAGEATAQSPAAQNPPAQSNPTSVTLQSKKSNTKEAKQPKNKKKAEESADNSAAPDKVLYDRAMKDIKKGRQEVGRLTLQTLINTYPDSEYLAKAKLAIADSYYKEGGTANLTQAIASYKDFIVFFPFLPEAPYAQMQVAMTHYKQMEKPDRDRTEARAAEDEFQTFLAKYPNDPLVPQTTQHLREVQEILAEGEFRVAYYYFVKPDRRAAAGRLISLTKRYPLYSQSDKALWMLGDIFEKSEKKEISAIYLSRIVRDYPLSPLAGQAKEKLVKFGVPVPQPDPKALAWMQAEQSAPREKPGMFDKPMSLIRTGPKREKMVAAHSGTPQMQPDTDNVSVADILTGGGGQARLGAAGGSTPAANTAVVEVATPGSGASGGSTVESPADSQPTTTDPNANGAPPADSTAAPATGTTPDATGTAPATTPATDGTQPASGQPSADGTKPPDGSQTPANSNGKESTSKKKKGIKKIIPW
ncbi:MAG: outer membrane protein assembly factor BamD [Acidobacteria bacterium]|nr:outer membrane protein assembly factor BamD [Acidobacteriota bacterium]MBS1866622.1 outer membrane protein assembly factor BamD [Acidobacteriota bacterium]